MSPVVIGLMVVVIIVAIYLLTLPAKCTTNANCSATQICGSAGTCVAAPPAPACTTSANCLASQVCTGGACVAAPTTVSCTSSTNCPPAQVCGSAGICVAAPAPTKCTSTSCPSGQVCNSAGACVAAAPAPAACVYNTDCPGALICSATGTCVPVPAFSPWSASAQNYWDADTTVYTCPNAPGLDPIASGVLTRTNPSGTPSGYYCIIQGVQPGQTYCESDINCKGYLSSTDPSWTQGNVQLVGAQPTPGTPWSPSTYYIKPGT